MGEQAPVKIFGSSLFSRVCTRSLESVQSREADSDQLPLLEGLEPCLEDIMSSVSQSSLCKPGSHIVFGIVDVP